MPGPGRRSRVGVRVTAAGGRDSGTPKAPGARPGGGGGGGGRRRGRGRGRGRSGSRRSRGAQASSAIHSCAGARAELLIAAIVTRGRCGSRASTLARDKWPLTAPPRPESSSDFTARRLSGLCLARFPVRTFKSASRPPPPGPPPPRSGPGGARGNCAQPPALAPPGGAGVGGSRGSRAAGGGRWRPLPGSSPPRSGAPLPASAPTRWIRLPCGERAVNI